MLFETTFAIAQESNPSEHQVVEAEGAAQATHTVFGDATRLAIMLAAVNHAGRRSGSMINYSTLDDDHRADGSGFTPDRRRKKSMNSRKPSRTANRLPCSFNPHEAIDEKQTIGALEETPDNLFANAASMCVLFDEPQQKGSSNDNGLLAGILLGFTATGVAARKAAKLKSRPTARPKPAVPRYSGATVVFSK